MSNFEDEDPLAAALSSAFVSSPSLRPPTPPTQLTEAETSLASESTTESSVTSDSIEDSSQADYEAHVAEWRAQSAEQREKAEKERERWEAIRAAEKQEAALRKAALPDVGGTSEHGWETVGEATRPSPSPADARDLVTGERSKEVQRPSHDTTDESQKWDEVSEPLTSSYPSMSFPDRTNTPSPQHDPSPAPHLESATIAIFDSSLSPRTRITALFSSLAINLLLPFVNGVMLGFGEIFAKNVVLEYFGWRPLTRPGSVAATAGLRKSR
ncbi:hypothetical protein MIND_00246200 [Mycena indigotica]|uniref:Uncharacterized protein n=1 Tax=Mycena indigotica TaxID=2126181 RepID=A0A8H6WDB8_9AGAR|nr:uncharacterized protein MIND_00246200 [Mycena indigotica]KAF7312331.1 hypothetical protein MIND_00246200 [Mycena indigotica]